MLGARFPHKDEVEEEKERGRGKITREKSRSRDRFVVAASALSIRASLAIAEVKSISKRQLIVRDDNSAQCALAQITLGSERTRRNVLSRV